MTDHQAGPPRPSAVINGWEVLVGELIARSLHPLRHVTFSAYFLIGVILFGGLGFWFELFRLVGAPAGTSPTSVLIALITFFPALVGSTAVQMIFEENDDRRLRAFAVVTATVFAIVAAALAFAAEPTFWAFFIAVLACVAALWVWWIANAYNPAFQDQGSPDDPVGGPEGTKPSGDLTGFKV